MLVLLFENLSRLIHLALVKIGPLLVIGVPACYRAVKDLTFLTACGAILLFIAVTLQCLLQP
jgi:hypothetical protein